MHERRKRPPRTRRISRTEMRVRERAAGKLRSLASSLSDSEDVGVKGILLFDAAVCRDLSSGLDIVDGGRLMPTRRTELCCHG